MTALDTHRERSSGWATYTVTGVSVNTLGIALVSADSWYGYPLIGAGLLLLLRGVLLSERARDPREPTRSARHEP